jgi:hypothetical protein
MPRFLGVAYEFRHHQAALEFLVDDEHGRVILNEQRAGKVFEVVLY